MLFFCHDGSRPNRPKVTSLGTPEAEKRHSVTARMEQIRQKWSRERAAMFRPNTRGRIAVAREFRALNRATITNSDGREQKSGHSRLAMEFARLAGLFDRGAAKERILRLILYARRRLALMRVPGDAAFRASEIRSEAMAGRTGTIGGLDRLLRRVRLARRVCPRIRGSSCS